MQRIRGRKIAHDPAGPDELAEPGVLDRHAGARAGRACYHGLRGRALTRARRRAARPRCASPRPPQRLRAFPHQLSGGMRQRVVGAMAIAAPPRLLIADEPTTSLDLTIQAQYLGLLKELQAAHRLAMIFVTHNLGIVARICDRVAVMYAGRIVEMGPVRRIFTRAARTRTRARCSSRSRASARARRGSPRSRASRRTWRGCRRRLRVRPALPARDGAVPRRRRRPSAPSAPGTSRAAGSHGDRGMTRAARGRGPDQALPGAPGAARAVHGLVRAVDGISFTIERGPHARPGRRVRLRQDDDVEDDPRPRAADGAAPSASRARTCWRSDATALRRYRRSVQAVFQDPYASLDPRMRVARHRRRSRSSSTTAVERGGAPAPRARAARPGRPARARGRRSSRTSSRAASASASPSRGRSRCRRAWSCWTSRSPRSTSRSARRS